MKKKDLIGIKFDKLTVVSEGSDKIYKNGVKFPQWVCECECGNERLCTTGMLTKGEVRSCGCYNFKGLEFKHNKKDPKEASWNHLINRYKQSAKRKTLDWNICNDDAKNLMDSNCHYCGISPDNIYNAYITKSGNYSSRNKERCDLAWINYNGIDRKDSGMGYNIDNIVSSCTACNYGKGDLEYEYFIQWIEFLKNNKQLNESENVLTKYNIVTINSIINRYKQDAKARGLEFLLTDEEVVELLLEPCGYCKMDPFISKKMTTGGYKKWSEDGRKKTVIFYSGIDRKNSNLGYSKENTCSCCKICNFAKNNNSVEYIKDWIDRIKGN